TMLYSSVLHALQGVGPQAREPVLAFALEVERDPSAFEDADGAYAASTEILGVIGRGDDRAFELICRSVRAAPDRAGALADLGDPRPLGLLRELGETGAPGQRKELLNRQTWIEIYAAIERLGEVTPAERAKHERVVASGLRGLR